MLGAFFLSRPVRSPWVGSELGTGSPTATATPHAGDVVWKKIKEFQELCNNGATGCRREWAPIDRPADRMEKAHTKGAKFCFAFFFLFSFSSFCCFLCDFKSNKLLVVLGVRLADVLPPTLDQF